MPEPIEIKMGCLYETQPGCILEPIGPETFLGRKKFRMRVHTLPDNGILPGHGAVRIGSRGTWYIDGQFYWDSKSPLDITREISP